MLFAQRRAPQFTTKQFAFFYSLSIKVMSPQNSIQYLLKVMKQNDVDCDIAAISAFSVCHKAHGNQMRKSGELYIKHPLGTAITLAEMNMNPTIVSAALLHDIPEDTE